MNNTPIKLFSPSNWRWIVVTYCTFIILNMSPSSVGASFLAGSMETFAVFLRLAWVSLEIAAVSVYVGWKSEGFTVFEPAIAAVLYLLTLILVLPEFGAIPVEKMNTFFKAAESVWVFVFAFAGAAIGEWIQMRKSRR